MSKTVAGVTTVFVSDGQQVVAEYDSSSGDKFYYHQNRQFNVIGMTDSAGDVVERYAYTAYGEVTVLEVDGVIERAVSAVGNPYTFTGRRLDEETGLFHFRARYYSAQQGRFISRDPVGYVDGMGLYAGYFASWFGLDPSGTKGRWVKGTDGEWYWHADCRDCHAGPRPPKPGTAGEFERFMKFFKDTKPKTPDEGNIYPSDIKMQDR